MWISFFTRLLRLKKRHRRQELARRLFRYTHPAEVLEPRLLLTATTLTTVGPYVVGVGDNDADNVVMTIDDDSVELSWNGQTQDYSLADFDQFIIGGGGSSTDDTLTIHAHTSDDSVQFSGNTMIFSGVGVTIYSYDFENVEVNAGGGDDTVVFNDTAQDEEFSSWSDRAQMHNVDYMNVAYGFDDVTANSTVGGADDAHLNLSEGQIESVTMNEQTSMVTGTDYNVTVNSFDRVFAEAKLTSDSVVMTDSVGDDVFVSRNSWSYLKTANAYLQVEGFYDITVQATEGGFDRAVLHDSGSNETLSITPTSTTLDQGGLTREVQGFERTYTYRTSGEDTVNIVGSTGNDVIMVKPEYAYLHHNGIESYAVGFLEFSVDGNGGNDVARLFDSTGMDLFTEQGPTALFDSNEVSYEFEDIDVYHLYGNAGGLNLVDEVIDLEAIYLTHGAWNLIDAPASAGTLTFDSPNTNADVTFTDQRATEFQGIFTNKISVAFSDPAGNSQSLSISSVVGNSITVSLATNGSGAITSTASDIETLINSNSMANALISAEAQGDGSGIVDAIVSTNVGDGFDLMFTPI